jgi:CheY-like chemotaxis protein
MSQVTRLRNILVVEDEFLISEVITQTLMDRGFAVHTLESAELALQYLEAGSAVDLLFTDINLPGAMDGVALAEQARKLKPHLPVVYASGVLEQLRNVPNSAVLPKPYSMSRACETVDGLLDGAAASAPDTSPQWQAQPA